MGYPVKQSSTAQPLLFLLVSSTDHITGVTGLSPTVTLSKSGGSFASPAGAVTEIANGWYKVAGNATDAGTLGPLILHATGTGADPVDILFDVVAYDPQLASLGLSLAKTTNITGFNDIAATAIVSSGAINTSGGAVSTVTTTGTATAVTTVNGLAAGVITAASIATDAITAAKHATHAVAEIQSGLATAAALAIIDDFLDTEMAAVKAKTDQLAFVSGRVDSYTGAFDPLLGSTDGVLLAASQPNYAPAKAGDAMTLTAPAVDAIWDEPKSGHVTANTFGAYLDASVSGVSTGGVSAADIATQVWADAPAGVPVTDLADAVVAHADFIALDDKADAVLADTAELQGDWANGGRLDLILDAAAVKTGMKLASDGVDLVVVETGINARQALALIGAATAGKASGLDTATATFYAMGASGTSTARILATTTADGNRTATTLTIPA